MDARLPQTPAIPQAEIGAEAALRIKGEALELGLDPEDDDVFDKVRQESEAQAEYDTKLADYESEEPQAEEEHMEREHVCIAPDSLEEAEADFEERQRLHAHLIQQGKVHYHIPDHDLATHNAEPDIGQPPGEFSAADQAVVPFKLSPQTAHKMIDKWGSRDTQAVFGRE